MNGKLTYFFARIATLAMLTAACSRGDEAPTKATRIAATTHVGLSDSTLPVRRESTSAIPLTAISCAPGKLSGDDTLTVHMRPPHGDYLIITAPNGTVFFVVYPQLGDPRRKYSQVPSDSFRKAQTMRLAGTLRANPRVYGRDTTIEPVFTQPGKYQIRVGEHLESDFAAESAVCEVTFRQRI